MEANAGFEEEEAVNYAHACEGKMILLFEMSDVLFVTDVRFRLFTSTSDRLSHCTVQTNCLLQLNKSNSHGPTTLT